MQLGEQNASQIHSAFRAMAGLVLPEVTVSQPEGIHRRMTCYDLYLKNTALSWRKDCDRQTGNSKRPVRKLLSGLCEKKAWLTRG